MIKQKVKLEILNLLYQFREQESSARHMKLDVIAEKINADTSLIYTSLVDLHNEGLIDLPHKLSSVYAKAKITPQGISVIEPENPFLVTKPRNDIKQLNINAPITNSSIVLGNNNEVALNFLQEVEKAITESPDIPEQDKQTWVTKTKEIATNPNVWKILLEKGLEFFTQNPPTV